MKTLVVSAVNLRKGGTLTILRNCLQYLSSLAQAGEYRVVALVHKKELAEYPAVEYIEIPWAMKGWLRRLWCEYVTMHKISKELSPVHLWLSLHDTTPRVKAARQAVYCQTSFPFYRWSWRDFRFDYKIPLFALFTKYAYRINIRRNAYLIVQQEWLREGFGNMFGIAKNRFIVAPPPREKMTVVPSATADKGIFTFLYAATPDCHKNFELLCEASALLENEVGSGKFQTIITIDGNENKYAQWLHEKWGSTNSLKFAGFLNKEALYARYAEADCLVFPSKIETWGLPISEFMAFDKPIMAADLPYAHETAAGSRCTAFFAPDDTADLKNKMKLLLHGDTTFLQPVPKAEIASPAADGWGELFALLLSAEEKA